MSPLRKEARISASSPLAEPTSGSNNTMNGEAITRAMWLRAQGKGYKTRINAILRVYVESQKKRR
jgi:uncharacterized protein (DUF4415 family)